MLERIQDQRDRLPPAERKVADTVLSQPDVWMGGPARNLAAQAGVSEPTVIRFCRSIGCPSYGEFKVRLAQSLVTRAPGQDRVDTTLRVEDTIADATDKVFGSTIDMLTEVHERLDVHAVERTAIALLKAQRIDIYGLGASGLVAADAQHKFFRLTNHATAYSDSHMQLTAAATLGQEDAVVAISQSGQTRELLQTVDVALATGATVIAITRPGSALADRATILLAVDVHESTDFFTPMVSRVAHLVAIDAVFVGLALMSPPANAKRLQRMQAALASRRVNKNDAITSSRNDTSQRPKRSDR